MTDRREGIQREDIFDEVRKLRKEFSDHTLEDRQMAENVETYHRRFDQHMDIEDDNGAEARRLAVAVENMTKKMDEMYEPYRDAKGVARSIKWGVGILLGLSAVVGALKYLLKI